MLIIGYQISDVKRKGFTLVELMVSMAITSILMLGMSVFFSSTFHQLFNAQKQAETTQKQFAVNEIIRNKFAGIQAIIKPNPINNKEWIIIKNVTKKRQLPFSFIGKNSNDQLVFKDLLPFNKMNVRKGEHIFVNSGLGTLRQANKNSSEGSGLVNNPNINAEFKNFSSFQFVNNTLFISLPDENIVYACECSRNSCTKRNQCRPIENIPTLNHPTDLSAKEETLFISNTGNGEVIQYSVKTNDGFALPYRFKYPTGLSYYENKDHEFLFVADTMAHQIKKVNLKTYDPGKKTIEVDTFVGQGDDPLCHHRSAKFCQLNLPTGLYVEKSTNSLFIADSGNNRILRVKDPEKPEDILFEFNTGGNFALDRIEIENPEWESGGNYIKGESNLIGDSRHFSSKDKMFKNPNEISVFANKSCVSGSKKFYANEEVVLWGLSKDMKLVAVSKNLTKGSEVLTLDKTPKTVNCGDKKNPIKKWELTLTGAEIDKLKDGDSVYLANPDPIKMKIEKIKWNSKVKGGFKDFVFKIYDKNQGPVKTHYHTERVGDGSLGTDEDIIQVMTQKEPTTEKDIVVNPNLNFPTGVTNIYYVNAGEEKVRQIQDPDMDNNTSSLPIDNIKSYDYTSSFKIKEKGINFNKYDNILELSLEAVINEEKSQKYKINAVLPTP